MSTIGNVFTTLRLGVSMNVRTYPVTNNLVDLFFGEGWEDWTRVHIAAKPGQSVTRKDVTVMGGAKRPSSTLVFIANKIRGN
jgi:hypothetical protein